MLYVSVIPPALLYSTQLDLRAYGEKAVSDDVGRGGRAEVGQCSVLQGVTVVEWATRINSGGLVHALSTTSGSFITTQSVHTYV